eukprot:PhF_6_TR30403/c0_g1_i4/m.44582
MNNASLRLTLASLALPNASSYFYVISFFTKPQSDHIAPQFTQTLGQSIAHAEGWCSPTPPPHPQQSSFRILSHSTRVLLCSNFVVGVGWWEDWLFRRKHVKKSVGVGKSFV